MAAKVLVLTGHGVNGEREMAQGFVQAGANCELVHLEDLIDGSKKLADFQIMAFPGGFSYADHLGSGVAFANRIKNNIGDQLMKFISEDKLVIGICNGFQTLVNLGILPGFEGEQGERQVALKHNDSGEYQCRWVYLNPISSKCIWTKNMGVFRVSVGHGEGNFHASKKTLKRLVDNDQIALKYVDQHGNPASGAYPINPNGAAMDIAGICDSTGRIFGLMPHPDRLLTSYNSDLWTLEKEKAARAGMEFNEVPMAQKVYQNAVDYFQ